MVAEIRKSLIAAVWFIFLTFPLMVVKVNTIENTVEWRWHNMLIVGVTFFFLSWLWRYLLQKKEEGTLTTKGALTKWTDRVMNEPAIYKPLIAVGTVAALLGPLVLSEKHMQPLISALIFIVLGLGLNIVVGLAGLLDLGYVAFYAVGAYAYALLNFHFGLSFWAALPLGAGLGAVFGILLGIPVLRLRGDYLAIVTLGFGEIIRLILENWDDLSHGPSGIANIPGPTLFGDVLSRSDSTVLIYYVIIAMLVFTIFVVNRIQNSRLGRSWLALREDEIACQAMGIDRMKTKLAAFAVGATWAGMAGVVFAAKSGFINPKSFEFWESVLILSIVVLGGQGSILGVILAAFVLKLLPEYVRILGEYRMLLFGAAMVLMMLFRPQGFISNVRRSYEFHGLDEEGADG